VTRQRRILLVLLGVSVLAAGMGSFVYVQLDRIRLMDEQISFLRKQYLKLPPDTPTEQAGLEDRIQGLKRVESDELARYYASGEMDLYRFGSLVNSLLARRGITVERFRTLSGSSAPVLELSARGTSLALMAFLSDVSASSKYWTIPYLHVQAPAGNGSVTCEMQIGYLVHEAAK
jgi:hypothetical protein